MSSLAPIALLSSPLINFTINFFGGKLSWPQEAELHEVTNAWEDVKDFKWHRVQRSPNWDVLPDSERGGGLLSSAVAVVS